MKKHYFLYLIFFSILLSLSFPAYAELSGNEILKKAERLTVGKNKIVKASIIVKGKRVTRTYLTKSYIVGDSKAFTMFIRPAREKGIKFVKRNDEIWMYSPSTERKIKFDEHIARQTVMGTDMSYEDLMEFYKDHERYDAEILDREIIDGHTCYKLKLTAKDEYEVTYPSCIEWIDVKRFFPLRKQFFAKNGKLIKTLDFFNYKKVDGFWTPMRSTYKDELKDGDGTDFVIHHIKYNEKISGYYFSKGALE